MDLFFRVALAFALVSSLCVVAFRQARLGSLSQARLVRLARAGLALSILAAPLFFLVVTPRVVGALKDGMFGGSAAIVTCAFISNALLASAVLGMQHVKARGN
jgi:hypothetical protein